ncbi:hypothetical protein [Pseudomonas chlororaphis]|uniref:hypothetical protein n=1 Tax=Pseudomonas chlororaphis TaxID=587753 RepID=UPI0024079107|nr:hypothetical protein [Pseudomonas chlororaphis]
MKTPIPTIDGLVAEAEFQVSATIEVCQWISVIARAIARDAEAGGMDVLTLTQLAKFFEDTGAVNLEAAFEQFKTIAGLYTAPQNAKHGNVARVAGEVRP